MVTRSIGECSNIVFDTLYKDSDPTRRFYTKRTSEFLRQHWGCNTINCGQQGARQT